MSLQEDCEEGDTDDDKEEKSPLPEYSRVRTAVVREVEVDGHEYVSYKCSCHSFIRHKCLCRHVYTITKEEREMVDVRQFCSERLEFCKWLLFCNLVFFQNPSQMAGILQTAFFANSVEIILIPV
jgi:hypothetical protein